MKKTKNIALSLALFAMALSSCGESKARLEYVSGDSWVSGYFSSVLLDYAVKNQKALKNADGSCIWIDNVKPFEVTASNYSDYKTYFLDDTAGIYTYAETATMLSGTDTEVTDKVTKAVNSFDLTERVNAKKGAAAGSKGNDGKKILYNKFGSGSAALDWLEKRQVQGIEAVGNTAVVVNNNFTADTMVPNTVKAITDDIDGVELWLPASGLVMWAASQIEALNIERMARGVNPVWYTLADKADKIYNDAEQTGGVDQDISTVLGTGYFSHFAGAIAPANDVYGTMAADHAIEKGWKTCLVTTSEAGDASDQPRYDAFKAEFEKNGGTIVTTVNNATSDVSLENCRNALNKLTTAPDFIYGVGSTYGATAITALEDHSDWNTKVITSGLEPDICELLVAQ